MRFSILSVFYRSKVFEQNTKKSILAQDYSDFEFLPIDNSTNIYKSAGAAYNKSAFAAKGNFLIFLHQDIQMPSNCWLTVLSRIIENYRFGIAGCAGLSAKGKAIGFIKDRKTIWGNPFCSPQEVQAVDLVLGKGLFVWEDFLRREFFQFDPADQSQPFSLHAVKPEILLVQVERFFVFLDQDIFPKPALNVHMGSGVLVCPWKIRIIVFAEDDPDNVVGISQVIFFLEWGRYSIIGLRDDVFQSDFFRVVSQSSKGLDLGHSCLRCFVMIVFLQGFLPLQNRPFSGPLWRLLRYAEWRSHSDDLSAKTPQVVLSRRHPWQLP